MRLINTTILKIHEDLNSTSIPKCAILSHCWGECEVTIQERKAGAHQKAGFKKITDVCRLAREDIFLQRAWVDTCCIDKENSAELSESINSMYKWYQNASTCYAFLFDVDIHNPEGWMRAFENSRWFTRGWTLRELIASVRFCDRNLQFIGTKRTLAREISAINRIPGRLLRSRCESDAELGQYSSGPHELGCSSPDS